MAYVHPYGEVPNLLGHASVVRAVVDSIFADSQLALDDLPRVPSADELAGLTPTLFEHINPLGTYTFNTDRPAGQLRPLGASQVAA